MSAELSVIGRSGVPTVAAALMLSTAVVDQLPPSVVTAMCTHTRSPQFEIGPSLGINLPMTDVRIASELSIADLQAALGVAQQAMQPSGPGACLRATLRLRAVARQSATISPDEHLALTIYGEKLAKYPADAVAAACEKWMELSPFWPSIAELLKMCEWAMQPRRALALALAVAISAHGGQSVQSAAGMKRHA